MGIMGLGQIKIARFQVLVTSQQILEPKWSFSDARPWSEAVIGLKGV